MHTALYNTTALRLIRMLTMTLHSPQKLRNKHLKIIAFASQRVY